VTQFSFFVNSANGVAAAPVTIVNVVLLDDGCVCEEQ